MLTDKRAVRCCVCVLDELSDVVLQDGTRIARQCVSMLSVTEMYRTEPPVLYASFIITVILASCSLALLHGIGVECSQPNPVVAVSGRLSSQRAGAECGSTGHRGLLELDYRRRRRDGSFTMDQEIGRVYIHTRPRGDSGHA
ncbi:hypothetical protein FGB62_421g00 [Gracilaria domingensis]|nr:hypothetical protein FGB62_421g00 [Gracilaria domingensis]